MYVTKSENEYDDFPVADIDLYITYPMLERIDAIVNQTDGRLNRNAVIAYLIDCGFETADFSEYISQ